MEVRRGTVSGGIGRVISGGRESKVVEGRGKW